MEPDTNAELIEVLNRFCGGFANRDADALVRACSPDSDLVVVTSEEALLRGADALREFLDRYVAGSTTYSWEWDHHDVCIAGWCAWLLAEGTETARGDEEIETHRYRMTMVLTCGEGGWLIRQVHGSSPH
jgi:ketosteroid isomerase-like protein